MNHLRRPEVQALAAAVAGIAATAAAPLTIIVRPRFVLSLKVDRWPLTVDRQRRGQQSTVNGQPQLIAPALVLSGCVHYFVIRRRQRVT